MKSDKLKKYSLRFGIAFLIILALLTYFSSTIDNLLMPQVKVTRLKYGTIDGSETVEDRYQIPISSLITNGSTNSVFCVSSSEETDKNTVVEVEVEITNSDDIYYEVTGALDSSLRVIYYASKDIADGDKVYVEEE